MKIYRIMNGAEIEILIENIRDITVKYAVKTLANICLQISELTNLKLEDVNFKNKIIEVINGKSGKNRVIFINIVLYKILNKYKEEIRSKTTSRYFLQKKRSGYSGNGQIPI